jgi:AcrR family transcriptional regulator
MATGTRGRGRPRDEALAERRREEILTVATEVFAEKTFRSTDVQEIADRVGVGKGTVYRYFPSKEELFLATVSRGMERLRTALDPMLDSRSAPLERLEGLTRSFLVFFDAHPELVELLVQERAEFRDRGKLTFFEHKKTMKDDCPDLTRDLARNDLIRHDPDDPVHDNAITALLFGVLFSWRYTSNGFSLTARVDAVLDILFHGILNPD